MMAYTNEVTDPTAVPLAEWELAAWRGVRPDRYQLVPGQTVLRLVAEIDRCRRAGLLPGDGRPDGGGQGPKD